MASPASESKPSNIELPSPEASDSAEVTSCLEAAGELWKSGQHREAIRFVQRGAEAAEQDGNDMRALKLARLGADLSAQLAASAAPAAPSAGNGVTAPAAPSPPHPANHPSVRVSQPPPLPGGVSAPTPSPPSVAPAAPSADKAKAKAKDEAKDKDEAKAKAKDKDETKDKDEVKAKTKDEAKDDDGDVAGAPPPPSASSTGAPPSVRGASPSRSASRAPLPVAERASASVKPSASRSGLVASAPPKPSTPPTPAAATSSSVAELIASGLAERVSVKRSSLDAGLLVVRHMSGNGAKPAHGARQAVLIYVDGDAEA